MDYYNEDELLSFNFGYLGKDVKIFKRAQLINCKNIYLDDGCQIDDFVYLAGGGKIHIGKRCHIAAFSSIIGGGEVNIADYAGLSAGVRLISGTDDFIGNAMVGPCIPIAYRLVERSFINIHKHAVLGTNCIVMPKVNINEGTAIGASSLVTKDTLPWSIYVGSPVKKIAERRKDIIDTFELNLINEFGY